MSIIKYNINQYYYDIDYSLLNKYIWLIKNIY